VGKLNERSYRRWHPHFGVVGPKLLHNRKTSEAISDATRPDQQPTHVNSMTSLNRNGNAHLEPRRPFARSAVACLVVKFALQL
jgi:hypothetical protein